MITSINKLICRVYGQRKRKFQENANGKIKKRAFANGLTIGIIAIEKEKQREKQAKAKAARAMCSRMNNLQGRDKSFAEKAGIFRKKAELSQTKIVRPFTSEF